MNPRRIRFAVADGDFAAWQSAFQRAAQDIALVREDGAGIRYCLAWKAPAETYAALPDLAVVFALGAGIERLLHDPAIPPAAALVKMAEPGLMRSMAQYVLWQAIGHHRRFWALGGAQREARWLHLPYPPPWQRKVGVLGLGTLGSAAAGLLRDFQFEVRGWSRSAKSIAGVACFSGAEGLDAFLDGLEILVCLLPLTPATTGILNADLFRRLAPGAALVNVGRGAQLNESDLLAALAAGQLAAASLDVTGIEPLPEGHPFWRHPRVFLTPHNAAEIDPATGAEAILAEIERFEAGKPLQHAVDRARGY